MKRTAFFLAALLFLAGCGAPAPSSQPAPEIQVVEVEPERFFATPYALEDVGYFLDIPEDIGIHDPNPEDPERKIFPVGRPYQVVEPDFLAVDITTAQVQEFIKITMPPDYIFCEFKLLQD